MKVNFLLPITAVPAGGPKAVFEYANRMIADGMQVSIIYPILYRRDEAMAASFLIRLNASKKVITKKLKNRYSARKWFNIHPAVKEILVPTLQEKNIPDADITFATAWETAEWLNTYSPKKGKKMYLIQHYEDWSSTKAELNATWKMPLKKIVTAKWLQEYATSLGEESFHVNYGLDSTYQIVIPIEVKNPCQIMILNHSHKWKGTADGLTAIAKAREKNPAIQLILFGTEKKPANIPAWVDYYENPPNLNELYNKSAIFISPSWTEGWGMPRAEAMKCGCATIISDVNGHRDFGINGKDLVLFPPKDIDALATAITDLTTNNKKRIEIATSGNNLVQKFTWEQSYNTFKQYL
ncbi:MAG: glycosyltransferase family 4 protein [Bacteroidota bacterium]|nr:glycosyltransferase family 4 protein [Bacteroidota bacterium]